MKQFPISNKKGFSLMEMMVAIFVFSVIMTAVVGVFARSASSFRRAKDIQKNLEDAQYAMNLMAKTIRTSSIVSISADNKTLDIYDYSQSKCIEYSFDSGTNILKSGSDDPGSPDEPTTTCPSITTTRFISGFVKSVNFNIISSCPSDIMACNGGIARVGKATISMEVCADSFCKDKVRIQTTVSLRDYSVSGL